MSKLIYAVTALALGALVSGFFIDSSPVPLFASIGLSALVMLLILVGWSRRIRSGMDLYDDEEEAIAIADLTEIDDDHDAYKPSRRREPVKVGAVEASPEASPVHEGASDEGDGDQTIVKPPQRTAAARKKRSTTSAKPKVKAAAGKKKPSAKPTKRSPSSASTASRAGRVLVIPGRSRYHRPGCRFAKGDQIREVSETTAQRRGYEACNVCGS